MSGEWEEQLRKALVRVEPPTGFAERVLDRIPQRRPVRRWLYGSIAAGLATLLTVGSVEQRRHEERMRAEHTQRQLIYALSFAADQVNEVNKRLQSSAGELRIGSKGEERR